MVYTPQVPEIRWDLLANLGKNFNDAYNAADERGAINDLATELSSGNPDNGRLAALAARAKQPQLAFGLANLMTSQRADAQAKQDYDRLNGGGGAAPVGAPSGDAAEVEKRFMSGFQQGSGVTNPYALAMVAAHGSAESGFDPAKLNSVWADNSRSGKPGTSGGAMSWRNERLMNMRAFAASNNQLPGQITPETQGLFLAKENPELIKRLNSVKSLEEAHDILSGSQAYAGYDNPNSAEYQKRLATGRGYLPRYGGEGGTALPNNQVAGPGAPAVPPQARPGSTPPDPEVTGAGAATPAPSAPVIPERARQLKALASRQSVSEVLRKQYNDEADLIIKQANEAPEIVKTNEGVYRLPKRGGEPQLAIPDKKETTTIPRSDYPKHDLAPDDPRIAQIDSEGKLSFPDPTTNQEYADRLKKYNDAFEGFRASERTADTTLNTVRFMRKLNEDPRLYVGTGSQVITTLRRAAGNLDPRFADAASRDELFDKMAARLTYDTAGGSFGPGFSNGDRIAVTSMNANRDYSRGGNAMILDAVEKVEQRKAEIAKRSRAYAKSHGGRIDAGFDAELQDWAEKNPIFPQAQPDAGPSPTATHPTTGQKLRLKGGQWVPDDRPGT
jgi:hypothetical protein